MLRVKGLEAQAAEEELGDVQAQYEAATSSVGASERDLLDKVSVYFSALIFKPEIIATLTLA